jgi:3-dehydroquinate synthase
MPLSKIKVENAQSNYSIFIGNNILNILPKQIKIACPKAKKIGIVLDKKIPKEFKKKICNHLHKYQIYIFEYSSSEKIKSFNHVNELINKCLKNNFNRNDILIAFGGGVLGDFCGFVASVLKRGVNFINIPSTLLAQVDSSIGGKTGVNSEYGKNLIGSFYQPKIVLTDVSLLDSLPKREMICGYAEILKHSLILKNEFFNFLEKNSQKILKGKDKNLLKKAIHESCKIKLFYVKKDVNENNVRMILNFGHTFAHAIEAKNKFSKKINHGEAVLIGMMMATKLSEYKKICSNETLLKLIKIYKKNNLNYNLKSIFKNKDLTKIISFMTNDKKNNDKKINLILLKKIGLTTKPGSQKFSGIELKKLIKKII